jgi:hypothetical protein
MTKDLPSLPGIVIVIHGETTLSLFGFWIATRRTLPPLAVEKILPSLGSQAILRKIATAGVGLILIVVVDRLTAFVATAPGVGIPVVGTVPRIPGWESAGLPHLTVIR